MLICTNYFKAQGNVSWSNTMVPSIIAVVLHLLLPPEPQHSSFVALAPENVPSEAESGERLPGDPWLWTWDLTVDYAWSMCVRWHPLILPGLHTSTRVQSSCVIDNGTQVHMFTDEWLTPADPRCSLSDVCSEQNVQEDLNKKNQDFSVTHVIDLFISKLRWDICAHIQDFKTPRRHIFHRAVAHCWVDQKAIYLVSGLFQVLFWLPQILQSIKTTDSKRIVRHEKQEHYLLTKSKSHRAQRNHTLTRESLPKR